LANAGDCPSGTTKVVTMAAMTGMQEQFRCDPVANSAPAQQANPPAATQKSFSLMSFSPKSTVQLQSSVATSPPGVTPPAAVTPPPVTPPPGDQGAPSGDGVDLSKVRQDWLQKYDDIPESIGPVFDALAKGNLGNPPTATQADLNKLQPYFDSEEGVRELMKEKGLTDDQSRKFMHNLNEGGAQGFQDAKAYANKHGIDFDDVRGSPQFQKLSGEMVSLMSDRRLSAPIMQDPLAGKIMEPDHNNNWKNDQPDNPGAFLFSGQQELQNGQTDQAIGDLTKATQLDRTDPKAFSLLSEADYMKGDMSGAAGAAQAALQLNPGDETMQKMLSLTQNGLVAGSANALGQTGNLGASAGTEAAVGSPMAAASYGMTNSASGPSGAGVRDAQAAMRLGDYPLAIDRLSQAIAFNPLNAQAYELRAIAFDRTHHYDLAYNDAVAGLKLAPKSLALLLAKAVALNKLHRYTEAEAAAREALKIDPHNAKAYLALAEALAGQHRNSDAIAALRSAAAIDPRLNDKLAQALQLPSDSDLSFLFPDDDAMGPAKKTPAGTAAGISGRFKTIAGFCLLGGLLLALGAFKFFRPQDKATRASFRPAPAPALDRGKDTYSLLKGQYQLGPEIGQGGMGIVYEGEDLSLRRRVAVKKMRDEIRLNARERERFITEAKVVAGLHHPGVVDIYSIVEQNDDVYLVFEYIAGKTLHEVAHGGVRLTFGKALSIIKAAGEAIDFAHSRNIIHRDLKPSNIMLTDENRVKVMDFGIARLAKDAMAQYSQTNTVMGTPPYMAPEQEQGIVRRESDVYALGVCLYEILTGRMPFNGSGAGMLMNKMEKKYVPATQAAPGLPPGIDEVFARAFEPDPAKRFHSAKELVAALDGLSARLNPTV
jgi:tetratricopeptide (TPR) repeat protein/tRNA A-37 threonylcarbamoyl transferase component Bud32